MKKTFLTIMIVLLATASVIRAQSTEEHISNFHTAIVIKKDGTVDVTEQIQYDFGTNIRHGIYRDIPDTITNKQGKKYKLTYDQLGVGDQYGKNIKYTASSSSDNLHIKIGDPNRTVSGEQFYTIHYRVSGALRYFSDHDELYWNATGNQWQVPIDDSDVEVILPGVVAGPDLKLACYTGAEGSTAADCRFDSDNMVHFATSGQMNAGQGLTIVVGFPRGMVAVLEPTPVFSQTPLGQLLRTLGLWSIALAVLWWYLIYPITIIVKWWMHGRDPQGSVGVVTAGYDIPVGSGGAPLSPAECGAVIDETVDQADICSLIVDLARRGYMKIEERAKKDFYFVRGKPADDSLKVFEAALLMGIFTGTKTEVRLKDMKNDLYDTVTSIKTMINSALMGDKFFTADPVKIRNFYSVIAGLALFTFNIGLALSAFFFGRRIPQKTSRGVDARNMSLSLKNFLSSQERQLEYQALNQMTFEKLLPFAVAFGVEKIWASRFEGIDMKPPSWYSSYDSSRFNSVYMVNSLGNSWGGVNAAMTPVTSSTGSGSGFSGGFSGGGGGGGGGGSW